MYFHHYFIFVDGHVLDTVTISSRHTTDGTYYMRPKRHSIYMQFQIHTLCNRHIWHHFVGICASISI